MCVVIRVSIGFRAGYHDVKLNALEQKNVIENTYFKNILQKKIYITKLQLNNCLLSI